MTRESTLKVEPTERGMSPLYSGELDDYIGVDGPACTVTIATTPNITRLISSYASPRLTWSCTVDLFIFLKLIRSRLPTGVDSFLSETHSGAFYHELRVNIVKAKQ